MKKTIFIILLCIGVAGVSFFGGHALIKSTSGDKFCVSCHSWMDPMVETYSKSVHGGNSALGIKAECATCHLPHDNMLTYLLKKGANGVSEVTHMIFNDPKDKDWLENRQHRKRFVFDSGCLECHSNLNKNNTASEASKKMHALYDKFKDAKENQLNCVSCHKNVGHKDLGKTLYEIKNPPVGNW